MGFRLTIVIVDSASKRCIGGAIITLTKALNVVRISNLVLPMADFLRKIITGRSSNRLSRRSLSPRHRMNRIPVRIAAI